MTVGGSKSFLNSQYCMEWDSTWVEKWKWLHDQMHLVIHWSFSLLSEALLAAAMPSPLSFSEGLFDTCVLLWEVLCVCLSQQQVLWTNTQSFYTTGTMGVDLQSSEMQSITRILSRRRSAVRVTYQPIWELMIEGLRVIFRAALWQNVKATNFRECNNGLNSEGK